MLESTRFRLVHEFIVYFDRVCFRVVAKYTIYSSIFFAYNFRVYGSIHESVVYFTEVHDFTNRVFFENGTKYIRDLHTQISVREL